MTKNQIISSLITKISNSLPHDNHIVTMPSVSKVINKSTTHCKSKLSLRENYSTNDSNKKESASIHIDKKCYS